jgi:hypothetical protein
MGWRVGGRAGAQCRITAHVRVSRPRAPPARVFAWRGELSPCVASWGSPSIEAAPRSCGALDSALRLSCVGLVLVGDGNYSCEQVVGGGDYGANE